MAIPEHGAAYLIDGDEISYDGYMKLSDEEIIAFSEWYYGLRPSDQPAVLERLLAEVSAARRRIFSPTERHLVVLESMFLVRNGAEAVGRDVDTAALPLHRNATVMELGELGLLCLVTTSDDFPEGLWRITEDGVQAYLRHAPRVPIDPDETADRTVVGSGRSHRQPGVDSTSTSDAPSSHEASKPNQ